ncbi:MAG: hypothetical protein ACO398_11485, partial [Kiritimatiellia bacterium]
MMLKLSVTRRIAAISLVAVAGFFAIAGIVTWSNQRQAEFAALQDNASARLAHANQVSAHFLDLRRREKDFLIRLDPKYV